MSKNLKGSLVLLITALIWGTTFIVQKKASSTVDAFTFNFFRSIISTFLLFIIAFLTRKKIEVSKYDDKGKEISKKRIYVFSILAGIGMAGGATLQQIALKTCDAGSTAFLTALYIIFVPILGMAFGRKTNAKIWICVACALVGTYILNAKEDAFFSFNFSFGSILIIISCVFWALQINAIEEIATNINPFKLCAIELLITSIVSFIGMIATEKVVIKDVFKIMPYILYAAVLSGTISFAFQNIGQKYCEATLATLIMSLESVFAWIASMVFLDERLGTFATLGCALIFISVLVSQIDFKALKKK